MGRRSGYQVMGCGYKVVNRGRKVVGRGLLVDPQEREGFERS